MATDLPTENPRVGASRFPWTRSVLRRLGRATAAAAAEEARNAVVSSVIGGIFWWLSHH